ncbi:hypothetical protein FACS1894188_13280 [Clostridia bacterium]|nr:hypothetical protein FACS1894188_13280 [Clostridia bacterium]
MTKIINNFNNALWLVTVYILPWVQLNLPLVTALLQLKAK